MSFSAKDVMTLREKTGLGMMDCKEALTANAGDLKKSEEWLRAKLKGKMDTRTDRTTAEGRLGISVKGSDAVIVEVRSETDFTSRNDDFIKLVEDVTNAAMKLPAGHVKADAAITKRIDDVRIKTGENVNFARGERLHGGTFGSYLHHDGKKGAVVQVSGEVAADVLKGICQHIVAIVPPPIGVDESEVPAETISAIREAAIAEAKQGGKNDQLAAKIAEGKVGKYLKEVTLIHQPYVADDKKAVKDLLPKDVKIVKFVRYTVGG